MTCKKLIQPGACKKKSPAADCSGAGLLVIVKLIRLYSLAKCR